MKNILVIGLGEVGKPLKQLEEEIGNKVYVAELNSVPSSEINYDVAHVAIPYTDKFVQIVTDYLRVYLPKLTIIHSTVKPGTTKQIKKLTGMMVVHSPVRGVHPNLYESMKTFIKYVGGDKKSTKQACKHLEDMLMKPECCKTSEETEFGKILSTTYYGLNILYAKMVKEMCDIFDLNFDTVYTHMNKTYNDGYKKMGKDNVIRPVLTPPNGVIQGHCVSQNFELLPDGALKNIVKALNEKSYISQDDIYYGEGKLKKRR